MFTSFVETWPFEPRANITCRFKPGDPPRKTDDDESQRYRRVHKQITTSTELVAVIWSVTRSKYGERHRRFAWFGSNAIWTYVFVYRKQRKINRRWTYRTAVKRKRIFDSKIAGGNETRVFAYDPGTTMSRVVKRQRTMIGLIANRTTRSFAGNLYRIDKRLIPVLCIRFWKRSKGTGFVEIGRNNERIASPRTTRRNGK